MAFIAALGMARQEHNVSIFERGVEDILSGEPTNETPGAAGAGSRWPHQHRAAKWSRADHNFDRNLAAQPCPTVTGYPATRAASRPILILLLLSLTLIRGR